MSTSIKIDRRKLRPSKEAVAAAVKKGTDTHARGRAIRSMLDDLKTEIELLLNSNYNLKMILKKLIEAGAPKLDYRTLRKYVMTNFPEQYQSKIRYNTKAQQLNNFTCPLTNLNASQIDIATNLATAPKAEEVAIKMPEPTAPTPPPTTKESPTTPPLVPVPVPGDKIERWGKFIGTYNRTAFDQVFLDPGKARAQRAKMETALCGLFGGGTLNNMRLFNINPTLTQTAADIINSNPGDDYNQLINKLVDAGISAPNERFTVREKLPLIDSVYKLNQEITTAKSEGMPLGYIAQIKDTLSQINFDFLADKPEHIPFLQAFGILLQKAVDNQLTAS